MHIQVYKYSLPFKSPLASGLLEKKSGLIIRLNSDEKTGWGDVSPLEGYSPDNLAVIQNVMAGVLEQFSSTGKLPEAVTEYPSLACGLEFAALSHRAGNRFGKRSNVKTARLLQNTGNGDLRVDAVKAISEGHTCLKIKVGRSQVDKDIEIIRSLQNILPGNVALRLDANRGWTLEQALEFSHAIQADRVVFIEEPLKDDAGYEDYDKQVSIPFAFDESLQWRSPADIKEFSKLAALVLKPSLLGGPGRVEDWARHAATRNLDCIISAMYESGLGMRSLLTMASREPFNCVPSGLDTYSALGSDIVRPKLELTAGSYLCGEDYEVDLEQMDKVYDNN